MLLKVVRIKEQEVTIEDDIRRLITLSYSTNRREKRISIQEPNKPPTLIVSYDKSIGDIVGTSIKDNPVIQTFLTFDGLLQKKQDFHKLIRAILNISDTEPIMFENFIEFEDVKDKIIIDQNGYDYCLYEDDLKAGKIREVIIESRLLDTVKALRDEDFQLGSMTYDISLINDKLKVFLNDEYSLLIENPFSCNLNAVLQSNEDKRKTKSISYIMLDDIEYMKEKDCVRVKAILSAIKDGCLLNVKDTDDLINYIIAYINDKYNMQIKGDKYKQIVFIPKTNAYALKTGEDSYLINNDYSERTRFHFKYMKEWGNMSLMQEELGIDRKLITHHVLVRKTFEELIKHKENKNVYNI